jgi:outer membrane protein OmpA-like peptidoglycan-associated protein
MTRIAFVSLLAIWVACGDKATTKKTVPKPPAVATVEAPVEPKQQPTAPNIGVSNDIAKACRLRFANVQEAPKFAYDQEELLPADRDMLQQVAECLTRGPLQHARVELVGRADPRGTDEYNLALGNRRAYTVRSYLQRLGVAPDRLAPTTRGEIDASGVDDTGWQADRRVDLQLAN